MIDAGGTGRAGKIAPFWIQTFTGRAFDLSNPLPEMVDAEDIAHALSMLCRYTGHCAWFYSVAQHSILVSEIVAATAPELGLAALLHDADEAYTNDWSSPMKALMRYYSGDGGAFDGPMQAPLVTAEKIGNCIRRRFRFAVTDGERRLIKHADLTALATEKRDLFGPAPQEGWGDATGFTIPEPLDSRIQCIPDPAYWKARFLERFRALGGQP